MAKPSHWQVQAAKRNQRALMRTITSTDEEMARFVAKAMKDATRVIASLPDEGIGAAIRSAMYRQRQSALFDISNELWQVNVHPSIKSGIGMSTQLAANGSRELVDFLTRSIGAGNAGVMAESMRHSARNAFEDLRSRYINDVKLSSAVYRNQAFMSGKIDDLVNDGILLGKSAGEIAKDVSGYINPTTPGGVRYAAQRLGRTELNNSFHTTSIRTYQASPYVEGVLWNLSGSHPGSDECDDFSGEVFKPELVPDKPHPNCFCFLTPITPTPEEFADRLLDGEYDCA